MIGKKLIQTDFIKPFSMRERIHILFGKQLKVVIFTEITAKAIMWRKEVEIESEHKGFQAFLGKPIAERHAQMEQMGPGL